MSDAIEKRTVAHARFGFHGMAYDVTHEYSEIVPAELVKLEFEYGFFGGVNCYSASLIAREYPQFRSMPDDRILLLSLRIEETTAPPRTQLFEEWRAFHGITPGRCTVCTNAMIPCGRCALGWCPLTYLVHMGITDESATKCHLCGWQFREPAVIALTPRAEQESV